MKRLIMFLAVVAIVAGSCGDSGDESTLVPPPGSTTTTTTTVASTTLQPTTATPTTASPTVGPTTPPTITSPPLSGEYVSVYFAVGDWIAPVARQLETGDNPERAAVAALLNGPSPDEMAGTPTMYGVADGAKLRDIAISNGAAIVDISGEFNAPTGTSGETFRLAALTFTLTELSEVDEVVLMIDGQQIRYFGGHGWDVTPSINRNTFMMNQGALGDILITEPAWWLPVPNPVTIRGYAVGHDGKVSYGVYDNDGRELATGEIDVLPTPFDHGPFELTVPYEVDVAQLGAIMVWDESQGPGIQANLVEHAVWLNPPE